MEITRQSYAETAARILMSALFMIAGVRKLIMWKATVAYFSATGLPFSEILVPAVILVELGGAVALVLGWRVRDISLILAIYTLATAFIAHRFWSADAAQFNAQLNNFLKNVAIVGGVLLLTARRAATGQNSQRA